MGMTPPWSRGKVAEKMRDELTTVPIPHPHCWWGGGRDFGSGVEPARREQWGKLFSRFSFYFPLSCSDLISNEWNNFPQVKSYP